MAAFRRVVPALAVVALLLGLMSTAYAQQGAFSCTASAAVPPLLRSEGITELTGDIVLNCTGGQIVAAGTAIPQANITVFLNTNVTSRLYSSSNNSEVLLLADEPNSTLPTSVAAQTLCTTFSSGCTFASNGTAYPYTGAAGFPNIYQGIVSGNSVTFIGVPIAPPGSTATRVFRITNIRANATPFTSASSSPASAQVIAYISITGPSSLPINNPQQIVGFVQNGLSTSMRKANGDSTSSGFTQLQCVDIKTTTIDRIRFSENFATAFKIRGYGQNVDGTGAITSTVVNQNVPGNVYNTETGFYNSSLGTYGLGDFGTRLKATFNNVQAGVTLWVSRVNVSGSTPAMATGCAGTPVNCAAGSNFAVMTASETGPYSPVTKSTTFSSIDWVQVPITNGSGVAVWEVVGMDPLAVQSLDFGIAVSASANPGNNLPGLGQATAVGSFAPGYDSSNTSAFSASSSLPIPRFINGTTNRNVLNIIQCRTNLLFPFVTNQAGFDTGLAIANTSTDPFGTTPQNGSCTLNFYGANAPAAINSGTVTSGTVYTALASTSSPNFQGYVIAVCNFQYGHGFAFVSDLGARNLAMGYLALVIPDPPRSATPVADQVAGTTSGESLLN